MGTHYRGRPQEVRALDTYIKLMRAADSVAARLNRHLHAHGLTLSQFGVLEALYHLGPMCQRELGRKLLKSSGNITMVVDNLERRGLVRRRRQRDDRRFIRVHLTHAGKRLMDTVFPEHVQAIVQEMGVLSPDEQESLGRLCKRLGLRQKRDEPYIAAPKSMIEPQD